MKKLVLLTLLFICGAAVWAQNVLTIGGTNAYQSYANPTFTHILSAGTTPSIAAGSGAGTSPTISITGTDVAGYITLTTGTTPAASAVIATVTFGTAYGSTPRAVTLTPASVNDLSFGGGASGIWADQGGLSSTQFTLNINANALTSVTTYGWWYSVDG